MGQLTADYMLTPGRRLVISEERWSRREQRITYEVSMRTAVNGTPPDGIIAQVGGMICGPTPDRPAGYATVIQRVVPAPGSPLAAVMAYGAPRTVSQVQFDAAVAALKAGDAQFEAHLHAAGYIHSSLVAT